MMKISTPIETCERLPVKGSTPGCLNVARGAIRALAFCLHLALMSGALAIAQNTNSLTTNSVAVTTNATARSAEASPATSSNSRSPDDTAFRIVAERNIFDANRSGGQVRLSSSRRPSRVESFTLVGTMAYEKGAFAFFNGSSSQLSKVLKANGVIASHKIVDVLANGVKLEADGRIVDMPIGMAMRREDEGTWHLTEGVTGNSTTSLASSRGTDPSTHAGHSGSATTSSKSVADTADTRNHDRSDKNDYKKEEKQERKEFKKELKQDSQSESEILKRLMERREKESQ